MTHLHNKAALLFLTGAVSLYVAALLISLRADAKPSIDYPIVKLRSLDKITARTEVFEANVGRTIKFGSVYIKVQACRKAPELEKPEAAAFLQVWDAPPAAEGEETESEWIFSGWMFASSPGLSAMDHPIYDVWVLDCLKLENEREQPMIEEPEAFDEIREGEGVLSEEAAPDQPVIAQ
ncbi:MAG: DUF2155 domain-containing protein [Rhodospirillales bacterium]|nr:DUF2155 domain-containing protein [Alphaproteobacteria bacterium]MCB9981458.1 DUF2155 domain-containing protein [Rhodospirillales bacterium]